MSYKGKIILQLIGFLLLGLLIARFNLDEKISISNFYKKFDVVMHLLIIIGMFLMSFSKKSSTN
ncbi:hypothetical protein [Algibacter sp. 2305UL17-15]|uniref:hypothetical protein n=1 Tax=Algibacter sp. 2305UL17-15 TaxID=3231268 RepID=UPI00345859B5